ncbi:MAG: H4MPT-linked C1 transfer pathway protein [Methylococcaceae bacterium]|nr:H4MPT-linked C1 transfer pathway protein [Methylococcaceae bacterium]
MKFNWTGWDIGGAHVKAAEFDAEGRLVKVVQQPCPLWKGIDQLESAVSTIIKGLVTADTHHAITMTGELVDLFANRDDGVRRIIEVMQVLLSNRGILIYAGKSGFLQPEQIETLHYQDIASANWLASATLAANGVGSGLFVDIGSTTTDILVLNNSHVMAEGYTDYQRLLSRELVYTGIVRTAVMAVAQTANDEGRDIGLMAEYFATMADVYRVTGELTEEHDQTETADGAEKSVMASARRLSRLLGCDFCPDSLHRWLRFAKDIRAQQVRKIQRSCEQVLSRQGIDKARPLVGAGIGRFLVQELAINLGRPYLDFAELLPGATFDTGMTSADCAPAVAVGILAKQRMDDTIDCLSVS